MYKSKLSVDLPTVEPSISEGLSLGETITAELGQLDTIDVEKTTAPSSNGPALINPDDFPDGGLHAWLCVFGGFCCLFCSFGWINCIGVFQEYYQTHQLRNYSPSAVSWISSSETFMMFVGGPVIGKIYDNYGPRYLLMIGTSFIVTGLILASISTQYYQLLLAQGVCTSLGASAVFYPSLSTVSSWFFKRRALAIGLVASGSSLGGVILPVMVSQLVDKIGFGWTMRTSALLMLVLLTIANFTVRSRLKPRATKVKIQDFLNPFRERAYSLILAGNFVFFLGMFLPINFLVVEGTYYGMSNRLAFYLIPILNAASIFGRVIPGWIADQWGRFNVHIVVMVFTAMSVLALWIPGTSNAAIIMFAVLYGFGSGAFVSLAPATVAQITTDISKIGVRTGSMFAVISIAALIGSPIGGALITCWNGSPVGLQIFGGCLQLGAVGFMILARSTQVGWKLMVKV